MPSPQASARARLFARSHECYRQDLRDPTFLSAEELDALQLGLLRRQLVRLRSSSPAYAGTLAHASIDDCASLSWLEQLPLTTKDMYESAPEAYLLRRDGSDPYEALWGLVHTTGTTTGRPTPFYDTGYDMLAYWQALLRTCKIAEMTADDVSVSVMPVPPMSHNAFLSSRDACTVLNAPYIAAFVGTPHPDFPVHRRTDYAIRLIERNKATVIWGIASYVRHLLAQAVEADANFSSVRLIWALGEACPRSMRDDIRSKLEALGADLQAVRVNNGLGFTEMRGCFVECAELGGCHNPSPDLFLWEVLDKGTGRQVADGERGMLALTHLDRRGTSLLRYLTGDEVVLTREPCPHCGRVGERVLPLYESVYAVRTSQWVKFKGVLLHPEPISAALLNVPGLAEFQIVLTKLDEADPLSMDNLIIRAAPTMEGASSLDQVAQEIRSAVQNACEIRPEVQWTTRSSIFDADRSVKARRFIDRRPNPLGDTVSVDGPP
jgi:phenylacetate-CoA ligase